MANDFLPFASAAGANVMNQADYAALTSRLNGFSAGTALSIQLNKVWRQSSLMAAMLGEFSANNSGQSTVDNGTYATLLSNFQLALGHYQRLNDSTYVVGAGTGNAQTANYVPDVPALVDGLFLRFRAGAANTGAATFSPDGLAAKPIVGMDGTALTGGEIISGASVTLMYSAVIGSGSWVLVSSNGSMQVGTATGAKHAVPLAQAKLSYSSIIGQRSGLRGAVSTPSASMSISADEAIVGTAIGGNTYKLSNVNVTLNLASVGIGGMDTGGAPGDGYVAVYLIYNPVSGSVVLLAQNATANAAPTVYAGANMPAGFTASALLTVLPTNGSGLIKICRILERRVTLLLSTGYSSSAVASYVPFSLASVIPRNAVSIFGELAIGSTATSDMTLVLVSDGTLVGQQTLTGTVSAGKQLVSNFAEVPINANGTPQTATVASSNTGGTPTYNIYIGGYDI